MTKATRFPPGPTPRPDSSSARGKQANHRQGALQPKAVAPLQKRPPPVAPPIYRPQPTPKVLQRRVAAEQPRLTSQSNHRPVAPPVYRPQPTPLVLQRKGALVGQPPAAAAKLPPPAPPVYRPQPVPKVLQTKKGLAASSHRLPANGRAPALPKPVSAPPAPKQQGTGVRPAAMIQRTTRPGLLRTANRPQAYTLRGDGVMQAILKYGPSTIVEINQLNGPMKDREHLFFNMSDIAWKKKGFPKSKVNERIAYMRKSYQGLLDLIADPDHEATANTPEQLKTCVYEYMNYKDTQRAMLQSASSSQSSILEETLEGYAGGLAEKLLASKRAFPNDAILSLAHKASTQIGFKYELELAVSALEQMQDAYIQVGTLSIAAINQYLPKGIAKYTVTKNRLVGGDITVWIPTEEGFGADFVQAKAIKFTSVNTEVDAARNQLEGMNASGKGSIASASEATMLGKNHLGTIFVKIVDTVTDINVLEKAAKKALQSAYVTWVIFEEAISGFMWQYGKASFS
jgi:hypothetical protein